jgi:hypothetical protein
MTSPCTPAVYVHEPLCTAYPTSFNIARYGRSNYLVGGCDYESFKSGGFVSTRKANGLPTIMSSNLTSISTSPHAQDRDLSCYTSLLRKPPTVHPDDFVRQIASLHHPYHCLCDLVWPPQAAYGNFFILNVSRNDQDTTAHLHCTYSLPTLHYRQAAFSSHRSTLVLHHLPLSPFSHTPPRASG